MSSTTPHSPTEQSNLSTLKGKILLVGLTGGIGSGKTTVSDLLTQLGAGVIDTDLIAHQITGPGGSAIPLIQKEFGPDYIDASGALNRAKMRTLVFENPKFRGLLEQITHPLIQQKTIQQALELAKNGAPYLVFVVPLLIESRTWQNLIDYLIAVDCPVETQIERVMHRNNLSRADVWKIIKAQVSRHDRNAQANTVIENTGDLDSLKIQVEDLNEKFLQISKDWQSSS